ncbi:MAG TPA: NADPH-dependent FMN reductase [Pseudolysinimonas sp.]|nr:NADPH-dependent FMN reductase [Pseudolysinimonas sp.]
MSVDQVTRRIGYIIGSISSTSINRKLAQALEKLAPEGSKLFEIPIAELPFYSPDHDENYPQIALDLKKQIETADGVIIVTPEYSRSIPGVLKNALDWASRPRGSSSFSGKPTAIIGTSPGPISTAAAQQHLRAILGNLNAVTLGQPEGYIHFKPGLFTDEGDIGVESTAEFLRGYLRAFDALVSKF